MRAATTSKTPANTGRMALTIQRSQRTSVGLPIGFARQPRPYDPDKLTPLATLLRGGRGGEVRLKLYLCLVLRAVQPPYDIRDAVPARAWAALLGLQDPQGNGSRRVSAALRWLAKRGYIELDAAQGRAPRIRLLDVIDLGSKKPFVPRGGARWITLPLSFFSNMWLHRLSASAVAVFVALRELQGGETDATAPPWITAARRHEYGLSDDVWTRGTRELRDLGLVTTKVVIDAEDEGFGLIRRRTTYWLHIEAL